jgi:hypothetical protein
VPERKGFDLGDYVEVKDRIRVFYESYGQGRLVTDRYELTREPDDKPKVIVTALAYRTADDPRPGVGTSWMYLPGKTSYTLGSEIENVETSAWGRAIGSLGILIDRSIATSNEIDAKQDDHPETTVYSATNPPPARPGTDGGLIGVIEAGDKTTSDFQLRYDPDNVPHLGFRLRGDRGGILVEAAGDLAEDLMVSRGDLIGQRVTCWGRIGDRSFESGPVGKKHTVTYQALALERLTGPDGLVFPVLRDAPTVPLFPEDEAELDAAAV